MTFVLSVFNPRGGSGKTTTAINLAAGLAAAGREVCLLDLAPEQAASRALGLPPVAPGAWLPYGGSSLPPPREVGFHGLTVRTCGPPSELEADLARQPGSDERLRRALLAAPEPALWVIDGPPGRGARARSGLIGADRVVVPVPCEPFASSFLEQALEEVRAVKKQARPDLEVWGVLVTFADRGQPTTRDSEAALRREYGEVVLETAIPRDPELMEAQGRGEPVLRFAPTARGAWAYVELTRKILGEVEIHARAR